MPRRWSGHAHKVREDPADGVSMAIVIASGAAADNRGGSL